jgi:hypothetical protein
MKKENEMKNRLPQGAMMRVALCLLVLLTPLAALRAQITNGTYTVTPQNATALRLDDEGAKTTTGNGIDVYTANGTAAQNWAFTNTGVVPAGYYNISTLGAYCLTASGTASGSAAVLDPCAGSSSQAWEAVASGSNFTFHPASNTALCLDVAAAGTASGTLVQVYTCNGTNAQAWSGPTASGGGSCTTKPNAPTGLAASGTTSTGTTLNWSADTAPANCSISSYTVLKNGASVGTATGTSFAVSGLTASTNYSFTVEATDAAGTSAASSAVSVTTTASGGGGEGPYGGTAAAIPGTVMAENYDTGGQGVAYNVTSTNGSANSYRSDGVDLEAATAPATGNDLGWSAAGQWFRYTVNVSTAGTYTVSILVASPTAITDAFHLSNSSGTNLTGSVAVPATGGYQTWATVTATVTLPAGQQTLTLSEDAGGWNIDSLKFATSGGGGVTEGPYGGTPAAVPGTVMNENYDTGGQGTGYSVTSTNGSANSYRSDGVDLEAATSPATGNDLGWSASGQWFRYTVNVSTAGTYTASFLVASESAISDGFHLSNSSGTNLTGSVAVPNTGGWQTWAAATATLTLPAGKQTLTLNEDAAGWNIDDIAFTSGSGGGGGNPPSKLFAPYLYLGDYNDANVVSGIQSASGVKGVTMAFLDPYNNGCSLIWPGANGPLPSDTIGSTSVGAQIAALQAKGVTVIISQGGAGGQEGAAYCGSASATQALYQSLINQYHVKWLDFDIEYGETSGQSTRRAQALAALQAANPGLIISYTLGVGPGGLDSGSNGGTQDIADAKSAGLNLNVVNIMAMDYGGSGIEMGSTAEEAAAATLSQIQSAGLSSKVGITPMIGQNDSGGEVFQLSDATTVVNFANSNSYVSLLGFWSLARDNGGCAGNTTASGSCSGVSQSNYQFSSIFNAF